MEISSPKHLGDEDVPVRGDGEARRPLHAAVGDRPGVSGARADPIDRAEREGLAESALQRGDVEHSVLPDLDIGRDGLGRVRRADHTVRQHRAAEHAVDVRLVVLGEGHGAAGDDGDGGDLAAAQVDGEDRVGRRIGDIGGAAVDGELIGVGLDDAGVLVQQQGAALGSRRDRLLESGDLGGALVVQTREAVRPSAVGVVLLLVSPEVVADDGAGAVAVHADHVALGAVHTDFGLEVVRGAVTALGGGGDPSAGRIGDLVAEGLLAPSVDLGHGPGEGLGDGDRAAVADGEGERADESVGDDVGAPRVMTVGAAGGGGCCGEGDGESQTAGSGGRRGQAHDFLRVGRHRPGRLGRGGPCRACGAANGRACGRR
nr:hypothetical protein [Brachybacterium paraconglomeratum]